MEKDDIDSPSRIKRGRNSAIAASSKKDTTQTFEEKLLPNRSENNSNFPNTLAPKAEGIQDLRRRSSYSNKIYPEEQADLADDEQNINGEKIGNIREPELENFEKQVDFRTSQRRPIKKIVDDDDDSALETEAGKSNRNTEHLFDIEEEEEEDRAVEEKEKKEQFDSNEDLFSSYREGVFTKRESKAEEAGNIQEEEGEDGAGEEMEENKEDQQIKGNREGFIIRLKIITDIAAKIFNKKRFF